MKRQSIKMLRICCITVMLFSAIQAKSQIFIDKGVIEYEVKVNIKKTMGSNSWAEMLKDNLPPFKTGYYHYTFADGKSVYKFNRWDDSKIPEFLRKSDEENVWYFDHNAGKYNMQKNVWGSNFNVEDSIQHIKWKLTNENRIIAGFNCRKAVGVIMDSVYVFAFYTEEIMISGGPCSVSGLPGMILGLTIPRMYASYIATKVMVNDVPVNNIKPVIAKKYITQTALRTTLKERAKEWGSNDDDPDNKQWMDQFFWNTLL
ncbi:MAG: GLPGLI family protein [Ferruginibacter sp.]